MADIFSKKTRKYFWSGLFSLIAMAMVFLRLDVHSTSAHMDEYGYLFVGKHLLSGQSWPSHSYIFGFDLSWYFFGFFDKHAGGLAGARFASVGLGLISLLGYYLFNRQLWEHRAVAIVATLLLAISASHLFISSIATYDVIAMCLLCWAMMLAVKAVGTGSNFAAFSSAVLLALAVLCKYIVILYLPLIAMILLMVSPRQAVVGGCAVAIVLASYGAWHFAELAELYAVQISSVHSANATGWDIVKRVFRQIGLPLMVAGFAVFYLLFFYNGLRHKLLVKVLLLVVLSLPLPMYHFYGDNLISLYKHLAYSLLFLLPVVAWFAVEMHNRFEKTPYVIILVSLFALLMAYVGVSYSIFVKMKNGYPDSRMLSQSISDSWHSQATVLSEDPYIFRYLATGSNVALQKNIKETTWLDNDSDGTHTMQDVKDALWDRKFDLVLLTDQIHPALNDEYRKILALKDYELIYESHYSLSSIMTLNTKGSFTLYRR